MKTLATILLSLSILCFLQERREPRAADYHSELEYLQEFHEGFNTDKFYEGWKLEDKTKPRTSPERTKLISDLPPTEKFVFFLHQGEILTARMQYMHKAWTAIRNTALELSEEEKKLELKERRVSPKEIKEMLNKLAELRKEQAIKFEKFIKHGIDEYKEELGEKELKAYLKKIQKYHDDNNLINREKEKAEK